METVIEWDGERMPTRRIKMKVEQDHVRIRNEIRSGRGGSESGNRGRRSRNGKMLIVRHGQRRRIGRVTS